MLQNEEREKERVWLDVMCDNPSNRNGDQSSTVMVIWIGKKGKKKRFDDGWT